MKFIKLIDGDSTWYLPKGLPGALAIVTRNMVIYCIKQENNGLPEHYSDPNKVFCGRELSGNWQYDTLFSNDHHVPTGYLYRYRHIYWRDYHTILEIRDQIKEDFEELENIYYKNKGMVFYLKQIWRDLVDHILP